MVRCFTSSTQPLPPRASLSHASGVALEPSRFRPNMVLHGVPAWSEFEWLGRTITTSGGAKLEVLLTRTVPCEATPTVDARHGSGKADLDVPGLLQAYFPQTCLRDRTWACTRTSSMAGAFGWATRAGAERGARVSTSTQPPSSGAGAACRPIGSRDV